VGDADSGWSLVQCSYCFCYECNSGAVAISSVSDVASAWLSTVAVNCSVVVVIGVVINTLDYVSIFTLRDNLEATAHLGCSSLPSKQPGSL